MRWQTIIWSTATVLLAAAISLFVARRTAETHSDHHHHHNGHQDFHQWLHANLDITVDQEAVLRPVEEAFDVERRSLQNKIEEAGKALAVAIQSGSPESTEVHEAHQTLLNAQGDLQRATLKHFFSMKAHLSEEQGKKLLDWTHDSLIHGHND